MKFKHSACPSGKMYSVILLAQMSEELTEIILFNKNTN